MDNKEQAFTRLVREHKSTIYAVCYMFSKDSDEINDLFQEILIRLWKGFDSFREESDIRTWIYRVSLNSCINADKKRRRAGERVPLSVDIDPFEDTDDRALQTKRLYARINTLGLVDRAIILLWLGLLVWLSLRGRVVPASSMIAFVVLLVVFCAIAIYFGMKHRRGLQDATDELLSQIE